MDKKEVSVLKSKFDELVHVDKNTGIEFCMPENYNQPLVTVNGAGLAK